MRLICELAAHALIFLVHCPLGCDGDHKSSGAHLVDHLAEKVIMDAQPLPQILRIARDDLIAKRYVADGQIKRAVRKTCPLKALLRNFCIGMGKTRNAG